MERLKGLDNYFKEKSRAKLKAAAERQPLGIPVMSEDEIRQTCAENGGYETAELNDKLYLHMRGYSKIENLEKYTGCKAIWLESNAISKIEGLDALKEVRCLYLAKNMINIIENLGNLADLMTLDLSNNRIRHIENLSCLPCLDTLNISKNFLETAESIEHLNECKALRTLDLTNNKLPAQENVVEMLKTIPGLVTLSLNGNEITKLPQYRKKMIHSIPAMGYLDRPVDEIETLAANAFFEGGAEAEKSAREAYRDAQAQKRKDEMEQFKTWQAEEREKRKKMPEAKKFEIASADEQRRRDREIEARKDAALEAKALELGVSNLALHMMQGDGTINEFYEAQKAAVAANETEKEVPRVEELPDEPPVEKELDAEQILMPPAPPAAEAVPEPEPEPKESEDERICREAAEAAAAEIKAKEDAERKQAEEEERERAERVAESTYIWKEQQAAAKAAREAEAKAKKEAANGGPRVIELPEGADENYEPETNGQKTLFWTEAEDIELARQVTATMFDFDEASASLVKTFDKPELTADACRHRWSQLDAEQWSQPAEDNGLSGLVATSFNNYVSDTMIDAGKKGHGAQPSFENLSSMASGQKPGYLKIPTSFPSTEDIPEDEGDLDALE